MGSNRSGSTFQGAILLVLAIVILGIGALLYFHRMNNRPASSTAGSETERRFADEERKAEEEWQTRVGDSESQILVLKHENERLKGKE